jgi:hypothetical protein
MYNITEQGAVNNKKQGFKLTPTSYEALQNLHTQILNYVTVTCNVGMPDSTCTQGFSHVKITSLFQNARTVRSDHCFFFFFPPPHNSPNPSDRTRPWGLISL